MRIVRDVEGVTACFPPTTVERRSDNLSMAERNLAVSDQHMIDSIAQSTGLTPAVERRAPSNDRMSAALWVKTTDDTHEFFADADPHQHVISIIKQSFRAEMFYDGKLSWQRETPVASINIVTAGREPKAINTGQYSVLHLYMPARLINDLVVEGTGRAHAPVELIDPECLVHDAALTACAAEVEREMRADGPLCSLRMDVLAQDAAIHLARRYSNIAWPSTPRPLADGGDWRLRRVADAMRADIARDWRIAELAELVGITPRHLTTMFRLQLGTSPHAWLLARRVDRARSLLTASQLNITGIALTCGFSSAQHFATTFRKYVGVTPTEFRFQARA